MYPRPNPGVSSTKSQREITLGRDAIRYLGSAFSAPMASWLDELGLNELEHIKDGASAFAQELHPINSAEDFISFVVALNLYPPGTPLRAERIAGEMPAGLSAPAVRYLLNKLPIIDRLASQLRDDPSRKTVRLVPDVEHCVACGLAGEAVPLVVKWGSRCSSPTVYAEHGRLKGELNGLSCPRCSAWHSWQAGALPRGDCILTPLDPAFPEHRVRELAARQVVGTDGAFSHRLRDLLSRVGNAVRRVKGSRPYDAATPRAHLVSVVAPALARRECVAGGGAATIRAAGLHIRRAARCDFARAVPRSRCGSGCLKPECLLSRFTAFWAGEHASRCLKPVPGSSTCDCYIIDGHHKYRRKCCSNRNARVVDMGKHGKATLGCSGMPVPGSRFCVRCRPFAARRTDQTAELEPGNQSTVTVDLSASEGLAAAFNLRLTPSPLPPLRRRGARAGPLRRRGARAGPPPSGKAAQ